MYVNIDQSFKNVDGTNLVDVDTKEVVKLKPVIVNALLGMFKDEEQLSGGEKLERWQLAIKINNADGDIELSAEEISLIKLLIGKMFTTIIVGQAFEMLENKQEVKNG